MLMLRHTQIFSKAILFVWAFGTEDFRLKLSSALQQLNVEACRRAGSRKRGPSEREDFREHVPS